MTQAPEIARPTDSPAPARSGRPDAATIAQMYLAGHITGLEGREDEFAAAVIDNVRTLTHNKPYPHQVNDAVVKMWLSGIRFARKYDLMDEYVADSVAVMKPILDRMGALAAESGERDVILEAICGWSTCHHQLVITPTHKEPGKRWFLSPFSLVLEAGQRTGQFDFDEKYVVDEFYAPRARGFAAEMNAEVHVEPFDPETRLITVSLVG